MNETMNLFTKNLLMDELLSDQYHDYSMDDIVDKNNERLEDMGYVSVTLRCVEKDIQLRCYYPVIYKQISEMSKVYSQIRE